MSRTEGEALAEEGAARALLNEKAAKWRADADACMESLIEWGGEFTIEAVTDVVGDSPVPNATGGFIRSYRSRLTFQGYRKASDTAAHARPIAIWRAKRED